MSQSATSPASLSASASGPNGWFMYLWPIAVLFHLAGNDGSLLRLTGIGWLQLPFAVAAVAMLLRPTPNRALLLALAHLPVVIAKMPVVGNHEIFLLLIHLTVILAVTTQRSTWVQAAAPVLRWVLLIGYSAIAFSKLNSSFVDRTVSCAVVFGDEFSEWVNVSVSNSALLSYALIALALVAELSVPILLMVRPLRRWGVVLGLGFHTALALEPNGHVFDFSAVLFVLLLLFLTPELAQRFTRSVERAHASVPTAALGAGLAFVAAANLAVFWLRENGHTNVPRWVADYPLWIGFAAFVLYALLRDSRIQYVQPHARAPKAVLRIAPVMAVVVLLTSLNAVSPYLEVRSAGAFNMYSNLQAFDGSTNHFVMSRSVPVRDPGPLYVYVGDADRSDPQAATSRLSYYFGGELALPEANLAEWAFKHRDDDALVQRVLADGTLDNENVIPVSSLARESNVATRLVNRTLRLRAIDLDEPVECLRFWGPAN